VVFRVFGGRCFRRVGTAHLRGRTSWAVPTPNEGNPLDVSSGESRTVDRGEPSLLVIRTSEVLTQSGRGRGSRGFFVSGLRRTETLSIIVMDLPLGRLRRFSRKGFFDALFVSRRAIRATAPVQAGEVRPGDFRRSQLVAGAPEKEVR